MTQIHDDLHNWARSAPAETDHEVARTETPEQLTVSRRPAPKNRTRRSRPADGASGAQLDNQAANKADIECRIPGATISTPEAPT